MSAAATFDALVRRFRADLVRLASLLLAGTPHKKDAEDLVQDTLIYIWRRWETYNPDQYDFYLWAKHRMIDVLWERCHRYRRRPTQVHASLEYGKGARVCHRSQAADEMAQAESRLLVEQFLEELPVLDRQMVMLWMMGYTYQEIAALMGRSIASLARAKQRLREKLTQDGRFAHLVPKFVMDSPVAPMLKDETAECSGLEVGSPASALEKLPSFAVEAGSGVSTG